MYFAEGKMYEIILILVYFVCFASQNAILRPSVPTGAPPFKRRLFACGRDEVSHMGYRYIIPKKPRQHRTRVMPEKMQNSLVSLQPPISK